MRRPLEFHTSQQYWTDRYLNEKNTSGAGSYGRLAEFKAEILNGFVAETGARDVIELGCGDGNQLRLARYPRYTGFDISPAIIDRCSRIFADDATKSFRHMSQLPGQRADVALSLDVIYHLIEDDTYDAYMAALFGAARRHVVIYSSNADPGDWPVRAPHVRHRRFTDWVAASAPTWDCIRVIANRYPYDPNDPRGTTWSDFHIFEAAGQRR